MTVIDLSGSWALASADGKHRAAMTLPGDAISALRDAGVIPDPFDGMNEKACRWVCDLDWIASRSFDLPGGEIGEGWYLDIDNLDTAASIAINGVEVLRAKNCFRRYRPDISGALKAGQNEIAITFHSNVAAAAAEQARQPFFIPYHAGNSPIPHGNMLRKPQCHFGWDWNLAVPPFGIYGSLALKRMKTARIEAITIEQVHRPGGAVELLAKVHLHAARPGITTFSFQWMDPSGREIGRQVVSVNAEPGEAVAEARLVIESGELWWPNGSGRQPLYSLLVSHEGEHHARRFGLRSIELVTPPDEGGSRFAFKVNGREIFCRGANWIPADALPSAATPARIEKLLRAARDANMNMIRVWGGGFYESEAFYDLCDELGLLVWQDAMFACHLYPSTPDFLGEVRAELAYQARRLQHRACIALWCGDNELIGALTWFKESIADRDRYLVNYDRLNRAVEETIRNADPGANWWPSSPSPGPLSFGDAWHDDGSGDMHVWAVWHEGKPFEHYRDLKPRFCSEFGFQSYPSMNVVRRFAKASDWNISAPVFEAHQKNAGGNARITETMFRNFRFPKDFPNFVYLSQIQHGLAMKTAVDSWRASKPHCMGTLYWQLNDTWPVCSWSGLDHGGDWKLMHHMARRFYAPVNVVALPSANGGWIEFKAINDTREPVTLTLKVFADSIDGTSSHKLIEQDHAVGPDRAETVASVDLTTLQENEFLYFGFVAGEASGIDSYLPRPFKAYSLPGPSIKIAEHKRHDGLPEWTVNADRPAFFVTLETALPGRFTDNAFDLVPGDFRTLRFLPDNGRQPSLPEVTCRHLQSSFS
jgi:beta-mannosidase